MSLTDNVWEMLYAIMDERYHGRVDEGEFRVDVADIVDEVEDLASKIEETIDDEYDEAQEPEFDTLEERDMDR